MTESFKTDPEMQAGTLSDKQIENACNDNWLISENFDAQRIRQSCYELRAGHIYYELDRTDSNTTPKRHELTKDDFILLKPKQLITIITLESLRLPQNALGRVLTKGQLFALGIIPVNTYADPGFEGNLGITFANFSNNYIKISQGQAIAKIEFSKLRSPVESPYQGQHGYQSEMWPIPHQMILSRGELSGDPRLPHPTEELELTHGKAIAEISRRMFRYERYLILASILYFLFTMLLIAWMVSQDETESFSALVGVGIGVVSNIVFGLLTLAATRLSK